MRWRLFTEEYSPDLQKVDRDNNVVANALSCLPQKSLSWEDLKDYSLDECHKNERKNTRAYNFHPMSYEHLEIAQQHDTHEKKKDLTYLD
jgi:hypothetical protein